MIIAIHRTKSVDSNKSKYLSDMFLYLDDNAFYDIREVYVSKENRRRGHGTKLVKDVIDDIGNVVIAAFVGPSKIEYPSKKAPEGELESILFELDRFFRKIDFININEMVGYYASYAPYLFIGNSKGRHFLARLIRSAGENQNNDRCGRFLNQYKDFNPSGFNK